MSDINPRYRAYLKSGAWRAKRRLALERCDNICESCALQRAVHVHHLTYARIFKENLEDLLAVCLDCHDSFYPEKAKGRTTRRKNRAAKRLAKEMKKERKRKAKRLRKYAENRKACAGP